MLAAFRRRFLPQIEAMFVQVLILAREMKLLKLGHIALDSAKITANASKYNPQPGNYRRAARGR